MRLLIRRLFAYSANKIATESSNTQKMENSKAKSIQDLISTNRIEWKSSRARHGNSQLELVWQLRQLSLILLTAFSIIVTTFMATAFHRYWPAPIGGD